MILGQWLGEDICSLRISRIVIKLDEAILNKISHKVITHINVLYRTIKCDVLGYGNHVEIIKVHWNRVLNIDAQIFKQTDHSNGLFTSCRGNKILSFSWWKGNYGFLLAAPWDQGFFKEKSIPRCALLIINKCNLINICIGL